jgi:hypothetical protein
MSREDMPYICPAHDLKAEIFYFKDSSVCNFYQFSTLSPMTELLP